MSVFFGDFGQSAADVYTEFVIPIETSVQRAIQIYKVHFDVDAHNVRLSANPSDITIGLYATNDPATDEEGIMSEGFCLKGAGSLKTSVDWTAPPSFTIARKEIRLFLDSQGTGVVQIARYKIFYKPVNISDIQFLQLRRI